MYYGGYKTANYVAVHGGGVAAVGDTTDEAGNGMFGENSFRKLVIADGSSNTLAIGERYTSEFGNRGAIWMRSTNRVGDGGDGTSVAGVCDRNVRPNDVTNPEAFSSAHPGGVLFVAVDCSVRFVVDDVDGTVYEHLGRNGDGGARLTSIAR